jgi:hypothetical protein
MNYAMDVHLFQTWSSLSVTTEHTRDVLHSCTMQELCNHACSGSDTTNRLLFDMLAGRQGAYQLMLSTRPALGPMGQGSAQLLHTPLLASTSQLAYQLQTGR